MTGKERYRQENLQYIEEGLMREVYETDWGMICAVAESVYTVFLFNEINPDTNLTFQCYLRGREFQILIEYPSLETLKQINYYAQQAGDNRWVGFTPDLLRKLRDLNNSWGPDNPPDIDRSKEDKLLKKAEKQRNSLLGKFVMGCKKAIIEMASER